MKINRREFIKVCQALGLTLPFHSVFSTASENNTAAFKDNKIIIIGAGAAGLSAGYLLKQLGIDFQILEASEHYGGRMKRTTEFADFPIPLGAEWLHVHPSIMSELVNDESVAVDIDTTYMIQIKIMDCSMVKEVYAMRILPKTASL